MNTRTRTAVLLCLYLVLAGAFAILATQHIRAEKAKRVHAAVARPNPTETMASLSKPVEIMVPAVGIDVPVQPGVYNETKKTWNISNTAAYFATVTAFPNTVSGTTLIYAHNSTDLFGPTSRVEAGDTATVVTESGDTYTYTYRGEDNVSPTDTEIFESSHSGSPQLILLTCSGSWNQTRRLLHFELLNPAL